MDTLLWAVRSQGTWQGKAVIKLCYHLARFFMPKGILINRLMCNDFVQGVHHLEVPEVIAVFGGLVDAPQRAAELARRQTVTQFLIFGNVLEQRDFYEAYAPENLKMFEPSSNTKEEAQKLVVEAVRQNLRWVGVIDYEFHATRSLLTLVRQAEEIGAIVKFIPYSFIDGNRGPMLPELRELGILIEACKLWWYQRKGDIASLKEALTYYGV